MVKIVKSKIMVMIIGAGSNITIFEIVSVLSAADTVQVTLKIPKYGVSSHLSVTDNSTSGMIETKP